MKADVAIEPAERGDAAQILALQKAAYQSEARIYDDDAIPPLVQTQEEMEQEIDQLLVLKAVEASRIVGSVRARVEGGTCHIGRLIVDPERQNRGLGTQLMRAIEERFTQADRYELFTGDRSERNLYLYEKLGYEAIRTEAISPKVSIVFLEKWRRRDETAQC